MAIIDEFGDPDNPYYEYTTSDWFMVSAIICQAFTIGYCIGHISEVLF